MPQGLVNKHAHMPQRHLYAYTHTPGETFIQTHTPQRHLTLTLHRE